MIAIVNIRLVPAPALRRHSRNFFLPSSNTLLWRFVRCRQVNVKTWSPKPSRTRSARTNGSSNGAKPTSRTPRPWPCLPCGRFAVDVAWEVG